MRTRPATAADVPAIVDLCCRYEQEVRGFPDTDEDDITGDWKEPGFDLAAQTLVVEQDGAVVGYATARASGEADSVIDLAHRGGDLEDQLLDWLEQREGRLEHYVPDVDTTLMETFARRGWEPVRRFWRMRIDFPADRSALPEPRWPEGVQVRDFDRETDPEAVHDVIMTAFGDIGGQQIRTFEQWSASMLETSKFDPSLYLVVVRDGQVVAASLTQDMQDYGMVRQLGVVRAERGKGIAKALLQESFRRHASRGLPATTLGVDAANATGALAVYENAGMHVQEQFTRWERPAP